MSGNTPDNTPKPPQRITSSGAKRERELARAKAERQAARRAERERQQKQRAIGGAVIAVVVIALIAGLFIWSPWKSSGSSVANPSNSAATPSATSSIPIPGCSDAPPVKTKYPQFKSPPDFNAVKSGTKLTLATNCGDIQIATVPGLAPGTVASQLALAQAGFFDLTKCHRLTTQGIFVLQCGDPTGSGTGGPGYTLHDENLPVPAKGTSSVVYKAGTVAMANAGPNTNGSQFFIVYKDSPLGPNYPVWGQVTQGLDRVQAVAAAGVKGGGTDGPPLQPVVIKTATVSK